MLDTKRLYRMARHLAYSRALHECPEQVAKDLEQAAWIKYMKLKKHDHLWKDLEYAMLEELSRWNWQCKRGRGSSRVMKLKVPLSEWRPSLDSLTPERLLILKEEIQQMPAVRLASRNPRRRISDPNSNTHGGH